MRKKPAADREFARYKAKGDPKALARVFDILAPQLLLVAAHFARDESEAEDLVQTTFLEAIESVDRFDQSRPLRPWLIGILVHRVRRARSQARRALDPHRLPVPQQVDPVALAEQQELSDAFDRALTDLPEHYQQVLRLHLVHGFTSGQIALSLGHPPATVRTWLRRGKEVLRRILPAGLAGVAIGSICAGRGLAAVKNTVLGAAKLTTPASIATAALMPLWLGGFLLLMKKILLVTAAILGIGSVGYAVWPDLRSKDGTAADTAGASPSGFMTGSDEFETRARSIDAAEAADPLLNKQPRYALALAAKAPPPASVSRKKSKPDWGNIKRNDRSVVRLFYSGGIGAKAELLMRNIDLNPQDKYINTAGRHQLTALVDPLIRTLSAARTKAARIRHSEMVRLHQAGELTKICPETVGKAAWARAVQRSKVMAEAFKGMTLLGRKVPAPRPEDAIMNEKAKYFPNAVEGLSSSDGNFVAMRDQLPMLRSHEAYIRSLQEAFFARVLQWFTAQDMINGLQAMDLASKLKHHLDTGTPPPATPAHRRRQK